MTVPAKSDYHTEALALLRQYHKGKVRTGYVLQATMDQVQRCEDAFQSIQQPYDITDSVGDRLDQIGAMVGTARNGLDDTSYRLLIIGKIAANRSSGVLSDILGVAQKLFQSAYAYAHAPTSAGAGPRARGGVIGIMVSTPGLPATLYPLAQQLLVKCLPAGVSLSFLGVFSAAGTLACTGSTPYSTGGFGSTTDATLGQPAATLIYDAATGAL